MREDGYYWVKIRGEWLVAKWINDAATYHGCGWATICEENYYPDDFWDEINERRIVRQEG